MLISRLYFFLLCAGTFLIKPPVHSQTNVVEVPETEIVYFRNKIDSLAYYLKTGDTTPVVQKCLLNGHHEFYYTQIGVVMPRQALELPVKQKTAYARIYALNKLAGMFYEKRDYLNAELCWQQGLEIAVKENFDYEELHQLRPALNNNCFHSGNYSKAMRISTEGLIKAEKIRDRKQVAHFNNVIGYIHMKQKNFNESEKYYTLYIQQSKSMKDSMLEAHALYNLADLELARKRYDQSLDYLQQSLNMYRAIPNTQVISFSLREREAYIFNKMVEVARLKGDLEKALAFALATIRYAEEANSVNEYDKSSYYINAGAIYNELYFPDSALIYLRTARSIAQRIRHREYLRDAYEQIALAYAGKKMYDSAFVTHRAFVRLTDSISGESSREEIFRHEATLQFEQQKQKQVAALERQRLLKNIMTGIAVLLVVIVYLLYNRARLRQKTRRQKEMNRQQNELFNAIASAQDQERKRIAEDIHDSLGAILSAAKLKLSGLNESQHIFSSQQAEQYRGTLQLLDEASTELRNISHNIMPATLSKLGLVAALKNLSATISSHSGLTFLFSAHDYETRINEDSEMSIYRIVLELINNTVKHANADKVTIQLIKYPDYINLSVEDNGNGFKYAEALEEKKGIGLGNIISRVKYLDGKMHVDTVIGRGTTVIIDFPLHPSNK